MTSAAHSPVMVGRAAQLAELRAALASAAGGATVTVVLGGEAGVGKTRLVTEFADDAVRRGARVIVGQCVDIGAASPYAPVAGALRELAGQVGTARLLEVAGPGRGALAGLLPELGIDAGDAPGSQGRLFEAVTGLLEQVAADQPLVLVVEDLHWADQSTRQLLQFVVRALTTARVLLVGTYRSDEMGRKHPLRTMLAELERVRTVHRIELPRLTANEVGEQLTALVGAPPDRGTVRRIHARSEGVPFLVEQLAGLEAGAELPESLRDLLLVRVEALSPDAQQLIRLLAVGRTRVDHELLAAVSDLDPDALDASLREGVSANLLRVDGDGYAFRHALVREVVHGDLLPGEHGRLHSRYAATLEQWADESARPGRAVMAEVAHHWFCAHEQERAFVASLAAAAESRATVAYAETQRNLERALELWDQVRDPEVKAGIDHVELLARAGSAATNAGEIDRALALVDAALSEAESRSEASSRPDVDAPRLARLLAFRATLLGDLGRPGGIELIRRALDLVPAQPPTPQRARLLQKLGSRLMMEGRTDEAAEVSQEAAAMARATGEAEAEFRAEVVLGPCLVSLGRTDEGIAILRACRDLAAGLPERLMSYHINLSDSLHLLGRYAEAAEVARDGIDRTREVGLARTLGSMLTGNAAEPLLALGDWSTAGQLIDRAIELDPPGRHAWQMLRLRAWLSLWQGDVETATRLADDIRTREAGRQPGPQYVLALAKTWAEVAIVRGEPGQAWAEVTAAVEASPRPQPGYDQPLLATAAWALETRLWGGQPAGSSGDVDAAAGSGSDGDVATEVAWLRSRMDELEGWGPVPLWRSVVEAHLAGLHGPAPDAWRRVLDAVATAGGPVYLRPYAGYRLGEAQIATGERDAAATTLTQAAGDADELGAALVRGWIDDLRRRARLVPAGAADGDGDGLLAALTQREHEVLRLVAAGRSNRQIGEELFISAKTASVHVSNILTKLGVSGRGEAAAVAHRAWVGRP
ncbi:helix-turn-helix transcriptional regulator [Jiangella asiatica]|uniref:Helix-turn-helix transcriptional regulator n=1 Tax=Jiangella asiatica TaxID=2530372 RepID=A0A4R5D5U8_9ACTN|nr:AAA family ATPase [Jiangella asiatica]TDE08736.1 helix-turn-helix transcriptional regulator [Jiangella asiatica]